MSLQKKQKQFNYCYTNWFLCGHENLVLTNEHSAIRSCGNHDCNCSLAGTWWRDLRREVWKVFFWDETKISCLCWEPNPCPCAVYTASSWCCTASINCVTYGNERQPSGHETAERERHPGFRSRNNRMMRCVFCFLFILVALALFVSSLTGLLNCLGPSINFMIDCNNGWIITHYFTVLGTDIFDLHDVSRVISTPVFRWYIVIVLADILTLF
jgi:hypothetical protein